MWFWKNGKMSMVHLQYLDVTEHVAKCKLEKVLHPLARMMILRLAMPDMRAAALLSRCQHALPLTVKRKIQHGRYPDMHCTAL